MPALFIFLLKVNVALLIFCAGYYLVLRHLTFYTLNRIYLIGAILFATAYPEINLSGFMERHRQIAGPVINWQLPARALIKPLEKPDYWHWVGIVFWAGAIILALRLLMQLYSLYKLYKSSTTAKIFDHDVRVMDGDAGPFSFWKSIYVNPAKHEPADLKSILLHEQVHVSEWHTLDILLAELSTIFYWFNPGVWLMKKAVRENIEFITDRKILDKGADAKQYQYSLVNVGFNAGPRGIVNHFNISTIKKRIIMMNAKRSSKSSLTRYAFLVPVVVALLLIFSVSKAALIKRNVHNLKTIVNTIKTPVFILLEKKPELKKAITTPFVIKAAKRYIADTTIRKDTGLKRVVLTNLKLNVAGDGAITVRNNRLDTMPFTRLTNVRINGKPVQLHLKVVNGNIAIIDTAKIGNTAKVVNGHVVLDTIIVRNPGNTMQLAAPNKNITIIGNPGITITGRPGNTLQLAASNKNITLSKMTFATSSFGNSFSVNHLSDKLIIINGRIATEADLKKLSAFDIDRMVLKTDEETKELYGDKAKNGIVFIVTKKK